MSAAAAPRISAVWIQEGRKVLFCSCRKPFKIKDRHHRRSNCARASYGASAYWEALLKFVVLCTSEVSCWCMHMQCLDATLSGCRHYQQTQPGRQTTHATLTAPQPARYLLKPRVPRTACRVLSRPAALCTGALRSQTKLAVTSLTNPKIPWHAQVRCGICLVRVRRASRGLQGNMEPDKTSCMFVCATMHRRFCLRSCTPYCGCCAGGSLLYINLHHIRLHHITNLYGAAVQCTTAWGC